MSLVPYDFYEELLKMAKQPSLRQAQKECIKKLNKNIENQLIVIPSRQIGKSSLVQALKGFHGGFPKKKEKKCFVFR